MKIPIVIAAFGTTTRALDTYSFINEIFKKHFSDSEILWSYSSRMVKDRLKKRQNIDLKHPHQVLSELKERGNQWAVVQSLHLTNGHEFYRLVEESGQCDIRTSIGLPLLSSPEDYIAVVKAMEPVINNRKDEALVMVGHGTDHPSWASYVALNHMFYEKYGQKVFLGVVEGGYPLRKNIIDGIKKSVFQNVTLVPFMLVAGMHFQEDLAGNEDSWKTAFEHEGIPVSVKAEGLGYNRNIIEIFCRHIEEAFDVIPLS